MKHNIKRIQIIGKVPKRAKEDVKEIFERKLLEDNQYLSKEYKEIFEKYEIKKTKKQIGIIKGVNDIIKNVLKKIGIESYGVPVDNIHILPPVIFEKATDDKMTDGMVFFEDHFIIIKKNRTTNNNLYFATMILHEMLHLENFLTIKVKKEKENNKYSFCNYERGIVNFFSKKYKGYGLDEAIICYQEKKSHSDILNLPELKKEKEYSKSEYFKKLAKEKSKKDKTLKNEIFWVNKKECEAFYYYYERKTLNFVLNKIQKKFSKNYKNKNDVFKEFLKAQYERNQIKKIKKLVEKTFGKNSFRILLSMDTYEDYKTNAIEIYKELKSLLKRK